MAEIGRVRWKMLALMLAGTIVIYVDRNTLGALAPILKKELTSRPSNIPTSYRRSRLVYSFAQPVAGYLTDLIGPRLGYAVAAVVWGGAAALHGLSTGWISMAGFRALLGLSEAVAIPTGAKVSTLWFPTKERSIATGWFNSGSSIGAAITPPLVIWLAVTTSWRLAFLLTGALGLLVAIIWYVLYRDPEAHPGLSDAERQYILGSQPVEAPSETLVGQRSLATRIPRHPYRALPDRAGVADVPVLDSALHGDGSPYGHQAIRAVRLGAVSWRPTSVACLAATSPRGSRVDSTFTSSTPG